MRDSDIRVLFTDRQLIILQYVANGWRNWDIQREMKLGKTVLKNEMRHIHELLDVSSRAHAAAEGIRRGLIV